MADRIEVYYTNDLTENCLTVCMFAQSINLYKLQTDGSKDKIANGKKITVRAVYQHKTTRRPVG